MSENKYLNLNTIQGTYVKQKVVYSIKIKQLLQNFTVFDSILHLFSKQLAGLVAFVKKRSRVAYTSKGNPAISFLVEQLNSQLVD